MHRREFLGSAAGIATVALTLPLPALAGDAADYGSTPKGKVGVGNLPPGIDVDTLGRAYLEMEPAAPAEVRQLSSALEAGAGEAHLMRLIERDFESGVTVRVNGWVFSRTELQLCAAQCLGS